jgi:transposase-like protein
MAHAKFCVTCGRPIPYWTTSVLAQKKKQCNACFKASLRDTLQSRYNKTSAASLDETRFICNSCNHMWFIDDVEAVKRANKLAIASRF